MGKKIRLASNVADELNDTIASYPNCVLQMNSTSANILSEKLSFQFSKEKYSNENGVCGTYVGTPIIINEQIPDGEIEIEEA